MTGEGTADRHRVGLLLFPGCDLLDVGGPYEVLLTAERLRVRQGLPGGFEVVTIATDTVTSYGGLGLVASHTPATAGHLDVLIVPGTIEVDAALADAVLVGLVASLADSAALVTSVCTGSFLLAQAGLLRDRTATTHHEDLAALAARDDVAAVRAGVRYVVDGPVVTAGGLSSGISLGLYLVERVLGAELAEATRRQLEYHDPLAGVVIG